MKIRKIKPRTKKDIEKAEIYEAPKYPEFSIELKHLPEAEKGKIKGKYRIVLDVEMAGLHIDKKIKEKNGRASYYIMGIGIASRSESKRVKRYS